MLPLTPPKLGRYEILDEIGKGAMGVVYLAKDPLIGRLVALKTFRIGYSVKDHEMEQFRVRFMREAQSAGILSHPNIVTIHDVMEQTEEGMAFIAMEYVRGTTLKAMLQSDQALSLGFVVDIIAQVAEALDYAHSHRVIHRDVKPANILITADNRVKITDFGIARLDTSNLTQEGQLLGTPNYMAPEQIQGKEVDHRADLFALGVVLYEMLTRHKPFQGENLTVVSHRIVYDQFTPPRDYARDMPPGLEPILDRALDKDPARRYQRAKDMAEDLRRILAGSRDDLNETLSIASWAPGTGPGSIPPPPPGPAGGGTSTAASAASPAGSGVRPPVPTVPPAPAKPAAAKGPKPPLSFKKIGLYAALAAVVVILGVAAMKLGKAWTGPGGPEATATPETPQARYERLVQSGEDQVKAGQYDLAAESFSAAIVAALDQPGRDYASGQLRAAREKQAELNTRSGNQTRIEVYLGEAKKALSDGRYDNALESAAQILALDATNADALQVKSDAEKGLAQLRGKAKPRATPTPTPARPQVAATPPPAPSPVTEEPVRTAESLPPRLRVVFQSAGLEASVQVRIGSRVVKNWKFLGERGGLLRKKLKPFNASPEPLELPAGTESVSVLVAPTNKAARTQPLTLTGGATLVLQVRINEAGEVSFN